MNNSSMDQFCSELVAKSESKRFSSALQEWEHVETFLQEEEGTCICGHAIREHCIRTSQEVFQMPSRKFDGLPS